MKHLQRFVIATVVSLCILVAVGVCSHASADVPERDAVAQVDAVSGASPYRPLFALGDAAAGAELADAGIAAPATPNPTADIDPVATAAKIYDAFRAGKYVTAAALAVILVVFGLRKLGFSWFKTDRGGAVLALAAGMGAAFIGFEQLGALTGKNLFITVAAGLGIAGGAAGIRHLVINLFFPPDKPAVEG